MGCIPSNAGNPSNLRVSHGEIVPHVNDGDDGGALYHGKCGADEAGDEKKGDFTNRALEAFGAGAVLAWGQRLWVSELDIVKGVSESWRASKCGAIGAQGAWVGHDGLKLR
jgi:hypothetical protein